ncbi:MAG: cyclic nucleotide-binding domain-containing protein [Candidatus Promineifilaceae bacterium]
MTQSSLEAFLGKLQIFSGLEEDELAALVRICDEYEFEDGAIIAYQRDLADKMIIVRSGRLVGYQVDESGSARDSKAYHPGDYFEDVWLFTPQTHQYTIRGVRPGRVLFIDQVKFLDFLEQYPEAIDFLNMSDEALSIAEGSKYAQGSSQIESVELLTDEIVELYVRRSVWLLVSRVLGPVVGLVFWLTLLWIVLGASGPLVTIATIIPIMLTGFLIVWRFMDWSNDYFIITNKHLVHREYSLMRFRALLIKVPIDQVQSVEVETPDLRAHILNTGTARVTTAAQAGVIRFDHIDNPNEVKEIINRLREQVKATDAGRTQTAIRASLEEHFQTTPAISRRESSELEEEDQPPAEAKGWFRRLIARIRSYMGPRVVEGSTITYRKHYITVLGRLLLPAVIGLASFAAMLLVQKLLFALILLGLCVLSFLWFLWRFEDWRNDKFQVTDRYVIDIDRKPFGFGESRKQAELGNVQNVNAERPGLFATLFNFGYVYIETAGAAANITFERVSNPNQVQADIFKGREEFKGRLREREGEQRRKELAILVDVYQQAQEQGRLPRRTPQGDSSASD